MNSAKRPPNRATLVVNAVICAIGVSLPSCEPATEQEAEPTGSCRADCAEGVSCAREDSFGCHIAEEHCPCPNGTWCGARDDVGNLYCEPL